MDQKVSTSQDKFDVGGVLLDRPFKILRLGHFAFDMQDTDAGSAFYSDLLGLRIIDTLDFRDIVPDPSVLDGLDQTKAVFMNHGTDHHSFVIFPKAAIDRVGRKPSRDDIFVNQISWQVGSLQEVRDALDWFQSIDNPVSRVGRDMPGSNWHSYPVDGEGHINEIFYGMEQIGWDLRSKPKALYDRGFKTRPELPQISEYQEIGQSKARGTDLDAGHHIIENRPFSHDVGGVLLARPFKINKIGPVRLWVEDMDLELDFYTRLFGLRVTEEVVWQGHRCVFLRANTEHHSIALYPKGLRAAVGLSEDTTCFSIGMRVASYRQLRAAVDFLGSEGVEIRYLPPELFPGMDYTAFAIDPDGHAVQLYAYMEQVGWDGKPRPAHLRRKIVDTENWPDFLEPVSDDNDGEVFQGPLG